MQVAAHLSRGGAGIWRARTPRAPPATPTLRCHGAVDVQLTGTQAKHAQQQAARSDLTPRSAPAPQPVSLTFDTCKAQIVLASDAHSALPKPTLASTGSYPITPLDHLFTRLGHNAWALVYPGAIDERAATNALSQILSLYPILAGQVEQDGHGLAVRWDLGVRGVEVLTATTSLTAQQLMPRKGQYIAPGHVAVQASPDMSLLDEGLPTTPQQLLDEAGPVARCAIVRLAPSSDSSEAAASSSGGTLLCVAVQHGLFDGGSQRRMLEDWAALTQSLCTGGMPRIAHPEAPTFGRQNWDKLVEHGARSSALPPGDDTPSHPLFDLLPDSSTSGAPPAASGLLPAKPTQFDFTTPRTAPPEAAYPFTPKVWVHFSAQHIAALKRQAELDIAAAQAADPSGTWPEFVSSNDVVCARMWQVLSRLPTHTPGHPTQFLRVTDYRGRLGPWQGRNEQEASILPSSAIGNWAGFTVSPPLPAAEAPLGVLAAELRASLAKTGTQQALSIIAWMDHMHQQGAAGKAWPSKTTLWAATDADVGSTSWDVRAEMLDFGAGAPMWLQRTTPAFIQNHLIVVPDMMPDQDFLGDGDDGANRNTRAVKSSSGCMSGMKEAAATRKKQGKGLWVALGLTAPDMEMLLRQGVEEARM